MNDSDQMIDIEPINETLPDGWKQVPIGKICNVVRGSSPRPAGDPRYFKGNYIPWLTVASLTNIPESQVYVTRTEGFLTEAGFKQSRRLTPGTLILANSGATLGVPKILGIECCANDGVAALLNISPEIDQLFLYYFLQSKTSYFRDVVAPGNGQPNLNTTLIGETILFYPPIVEQQKIASILSKWDEGIEKLQKLIAYKAESKRGLMDQLLTGRRRFREFEGMEWKTVRFGDIARINSAALPESTPPTSSFYYIDLSCVKEGYIDFPNNKITFSESSPRARRKLEKGDVLMSTVRPNLKGFALVDFDAENFICSTGFAVLKPNNPANSAFIYQNLYSKKIENQINALVTGSNYPAINASDVANLEIDYPTDDRERTRIAAVLSAADLELKGLREELALRRQQKTGLMHRLLTRGTGREE